MFNFRFLTSILFCLFVHIVCFAAPPGNDDVGGAIILTPSFTSNPITGDLTDATKSTANTALKITATNEDVWYSFTSNSNNQFISIIGTSNDFKPAFQIFTGTPSALVLVGTGTTYSSTTTSIKQLITNSSLNPVYYIRVFHNSSTLPTDKTFSIEVLSPPTNDDCAGAIVLTSSKKCSPTDGEFLNSTKTTPAPSSQDKNDVWYSFVAKTASHYINVYGHDQKYQSGIEVYQGTCGTTSFSKLTPANSLFTNSVTSMSATVTGLTPNQTYYYRVFNSGTNAIDTTTFSTCIEDFIPNDECTGADTLIAGKPGEACSSEQGRMQGASLSSSASTCATSNSTDVWYIFQAINSKHFIKVSGQFDINPGIQFYPGNCSTTPLACVNTSGSTNPGSVEQTSVTNLIKGNWYYVRIYAINGKTATNSYFNICITTPPKNDECDSAILLKPGLVCNGEFGDGTYASQSIAAKNSTYGDANDDVWYKFIADTTTAFISVSGSSTYDAVVEVFEGCTPATSTTVAKPINSKFINDDLYDKDQFGNAAIINLIKGNTYYYRVYDKGTANADYSFSTCVVNPVQNDECEKATTIKPTYACKMLDGDGTYASASTFAGAATIDKDVWYKFDATSANYTISINASLNCTPILEVFKSCTNATPVKKVTNLTQACQDDAGSVKITGLTPGTYYYRIYNSYKDPSSDGSKPATYTFSTCVSMSPKNDDCGTNATVVTAGDACSSVTSDAKYATASAFAACETGGNANDDVWFTFTAQNSTQFINIKADDYQYDPVVQLYTKNCVALSGATFCNDIDYKTKAKDNKVYFTGLTKNTEYMYRVYDHSSTNPDTMTFTTCVVNPVKNDDCASAKSVTVGKTCTSSQGDGTYASLSLTSTPGKGIPNDDVWFTFVPTKSEMYLSVEPTGKKYDPVVQVFKGPNCPTAYSQNLVAEDVNFPKGSFGNMKLTGLTPGLTYYYCVYDATDANPDTMTFNTCVVEATENDDCKGALNLTPGQTYNPTDGDGTYATQTMPACNTANMANDDVWFKFKAERDTQFITVIPTNPNYRPIIQVFKNCPTSGNPTPLATDNCISSSSKGNLFTNGIIGLTKGNTYYYRVYDYETSNSGKMTFTTGVVNPVSNDECAKATEVIASSTCNSVSGDGTYAFESKSGCSGGTANDDVWFKFKPINDSQVIYVDPSLGYDPVVEVYSGCGATPSTSIPVANTCNDVRFPAGGRGSNLITGLNTAAPFYYYRVYDKNTGKSSALTFTTCVTDPPKPPANDEPCNAILINPEQSCNLKTYTNEAATASSAVSAPGCGYNGGDVWFKVKVPFSGQLTFTLKELVIKGGGMGIYSGTSCTNLKLINKCEGGTSSMPTITISKLTPGDYLWIRVWEYNNDNNGTFNLCVTKPNEAPLVGSCANQDFESDLINWFGSTGISVKGIASAASPNYAPDKFGVTTPASRFKIMTTGIDPVGGFKTVYNGGKSIRLGSNETGGIGQSVEQYFPVTQANSSFTYNYAVVLQSGDHPAPEQPFFKVELFDDDGVQIGCGDYLVAAPKTGVGDNIGLIKSPKFTNVTYKPWSKVNINLRPYIGKNIHIRFSVGDCSNKGHFGYVYLDCECKPFEISADPDIYIKPSKYCVGDSVKLYAPKGGLSYKWTEVGSSTVPTTVNMTTDSLVYKATTSGTPTFTCDVTMFGTSLCSSNIPITLDIGSTPNLVVTDPDSVCLGEKIDLTDPAIMFGSAAGINSIKYFTDKAHTNQISDPTNILSGTKYYFRAEKSTTCFADSAINVVFNPLPTATITTDVELCKNATSPELTFTGATGKAPYTFTYDINSGGNSTIQTTSGNSVTVSAPTTTAGTFDYNLTKVTDANGCSQVQTGKATVKVNDIVVTTISCGTPTTSTVEFKWTNNAAATGGYDYKYTTNSTPQKTGLGTLPAGSDKVNINHPFDMDETVTITLTPKGDPCGSPSTGSCKTLNCTPPVVTVVPKKVLCHDESYTGISFTSNDPNATYTWTNGLVASAKIGQITSGTSSTFPTFTAVNTTNEPILDTIFVKAKNSLGCESPAMEHYITVNPKGQVEKPTAQEVCAGQETTKIVFSTQNTGGTTTYPWTNSDATIGLNSPGNGDIAEFKTINASTTAKVATLTISPTFTNDGKSCVGTETFTITVNPLPKIVATNSGPICGSSTNFTLNETGAQATSWSWSSNQTASFTDKTKQNPTVSGGVNNQEYKVIGTDAKGCVDSAKTTLTVKPAPAFTPSVDTACVNGTLTFNANFSLASHTYAWSGPNGFTDNNATFPITNVTLNHAGKYYIKITDAVGCSKTDSVNAVINPYPVIADITKSICYGGVFDTIPNNTFLVTNIVPTGTTYTWALPTTTVADVTGITAGSDQTSFTQNLANPTSVIKNVNYEVTASSGTSPHKCSSKFNVSIKLNPKPSIATINKVVCSTQSFDTIPNSTILTTNIIPLGTTYSWLLPSNLSGINGATSDNNKTSFNQTLTNTTATPIDVSYAITAVSTPSPDLCLNTFDAIIRVNPTPNISNISLAICSGETFDTIPNNLVNIIPTGTKYAWNITTPPSGITGITSESNQSSIKQTLKNTTSSPINVTYVITASSGTGISQCTSTFDVVVTVNPTPTIQAKNSGPICANDPSFSLDETGTDAVSWKWYSNLSSSTATFDDKTLEKPTVKKAKNGEIFRVVGKDVNGCIDSATTTIIINPVPVITPQEVCVDKKVTLTATHSPASANAWKSEDITIATIDPTNGEMSGITAGTGKIVYTDDKGCMDTSNVTINGLPTITTVPLEVCEGSNLLVKADHLAASTNAWSSSIPTNATISGNGVAFGIKPGKTNLQFKDNKGCTTTEELTVNIKPVADFKAIYESICVSDSLFLIDKSKPLSHTYIWSFGDGLSSKHNAHKYLTGGVFDITLVSITEKGCMDTMTKNKYIEVIGLPKVTFSFTPDSIDIFEPEIRFTNHSDAKHYKWVFGDGLPSSVQENPMHTFPTTTGQHYTVTLTGYNTQNGCSTSYSQIIVAKEPLIYYIPNTFTPNGDEYNNVFKPIFYSGLDVYNYHFTIYNRWGEVIFESFNVDFGWDGTYGNQVVESATYIWKLEFKEKNKENTHSKTGHVNVLR